ncbi:tRNA (guanosine(46)-N7)-methyltransferase TrmB [Amylibacter sp.]|nr:tRNA (guanosine(46)-N7)-methyltransferase TrmB [Amylibacter sp.]
MTKREKHVSGAPRRNFYGRIKGKSLQKSQERYMSEDLEALKPKNVTWADNPERNLIHPREWFEDDREIWLEIGFGGGEHLVHQASSNPDKGIIGCEPYINGVAMLLGKIRSAKVNNIIVYPGDARDMMDILPKETISRAFLLYPDPWPKTRHHRRRFVTPEHLEPLAACLKSGAIFRVATDIEDYVRQTLEEVHLNGNFEWLAESASDWKQPWDDWISTRYELKALRENRTPHYLTFRKI